MASVIVDLPAPVSPQIKNNGESASGGTVKSMIASVNEARFNMLIFSIFILNKNVGFTAYGGFFIQELKEFLKN